MARGELHESASGCASRSRLSRSPTPNAGDAVEVRARFRLTTTAPPAPEPDPATATGTDPKGVQPTSETGSAVASGRRRERGSESGTAPASDVSTAPPVSSELIEKRACFESGPPSSATAPGPDVK